MVPSLEDRILYLENLPPDIDTVYTPGIPQIVVIRDTVEVTTPSVEEPVLVEDQDPIKRYRTVYWDDLIRGTIHTKLTDGRLTETYIDYRLVQPITETVRVDTLHITNTRTVIQFKPAPKTLRFQVGLMVGSSIDGRLQVGPSIGFLDRRDNNFGYSYDLINETHLVTYRGTLR